MHERGELFEQREKLPGSRIKEDFVKAEMIKDDAVIIDVGITRVEDDSKPKGYRIVGDVDFANESKKASFITPVPGGVGPMTIAMLLKNTLLARERHRSQK